jgi:serine/threonine protein phosphatase PrpC
VANAGDCNAVLLRKKSATEYETILLSESFSANEMKEQERLKKQFPKEKDIVMCKGTDACYVKGVLMPTRSFGDFYMKDETFFNGNRDYE